MIGISPLAILFLAQGIVSVIYISREGISTCFLRIQIQRHCFIVVAEILFINLHIVLRDGIKVLFLAGQQGNRFVSLIVAFLVNGCLAYGIYIAAQKNFRGFSRASLSYVFIQCGVCYVLWNSFLFLDSFSRGDLFIIAWYSIIISKCLLVFASLLSRMQVRGLTQSGSEQYLSRFIHLFLLALGVYVIEFFLVWNLGLFIAY